jgi:hypothetical protein
MTAERLARWMDEPSLSYMHRESDQQCVMKLAEEVVERSEEEEAERDNRRKWRIRKQSLVTRRCNRIAHESKDCYPTWRAYHHILVYLTDSSVWQVASTIQSCNILLPHSLATIARSDSRGREQIRQRRTSPTDSQYVCSIPNPPFSTMVNNHQQNGRSDASSNTNKSVNPKPGWRMLSSTELPTLHALNRGNGNSSNSNSQQTSTQHNAVASSSKSVLPMHSLIDTAPSPLPFIYPDARIGLSETPEYFPSGAVVPTAPPEGTGPSVIGSTVPAVPTDGRTLCVRHQMMADQDVNGKLQKASSFTFQFHLR